MKVLFVLLLVITSTILLLDTKAYAVTMAFEGTSIMPPQTSLTCDSLNEDNIGQTNTLYLCTFWFHGILPYNGVKSCSLTVQDNTLNKSILNVTLKDMLSNENALHSKDANITPLDDKNSLFEYAFNYPVQLYFTEEGYHQVISNLNCAFWSDDDTPQPISVMDLQLISPTAYLQYKFVKEQLAEQKRFNEEQIKSNERSYNISVILAVTALISAIGTVSRLLRKNNTRSVEITKIHDALRIEKNKKS